jgi:hypothetical protein
MGRDNPVARQQLQLKILGTTDIFVREPIEIKWKYLKEQLHSRSKKTFSRLGKKTVALHWTTGL